MKKIVTFILLLCMILTLAACGKASDMKHVTTWVKGHASNQYNNRCDELAVAESQRYK